MSEEATGNANGKQTQLVLDWAHEVMVKKYITGSKVLVWEGTPAIMKRLKHGKHIKSVTVHGMKDTDLDLESEMEIRCAGEPTHESDLIPGSEQTGNYDGVIAFSRAIIENTGRERFVSEFIRQVGETIRSGGVFVAVLLDSGVIHRKIHVESKGQMVLESGLIRLEVVDKENKGYGGVLNLGVKTRTGSTKIDLRPYIRNTPIVNLTTVLRNAEQQGFEILECMNLTEFVYTYHSTPPFNELLHEKKLWNKGGKIYPDEKDFLGLFTTLVIRKKRHHPCETWSALTELMQSQAPIQTQDVSQDEPARAPDDDFMDVDVAWG
eukprot:TRINITY_DN4725_c0_g1_i1.p1 TRINITY_DN4725_c0_g1~~TRINITY_DN4725_c0_g1_i1.p1  ORF type:complete len:322 (+),score=31.22 TRINITY_DN4725_c0_g1_i1:317-1282(+)